MNMLACELDRSIETPLYEQLYLFIKKEIIDGRLEYGTKLPSKRKLAEFLKISQSTVETAYDQLLAEGYIEARPRRGYYVLKFEDLEYVQIETKKQKQVKKKEKEEDYLYHFHPSHIDTKNFPFNKWRKYAKTIISDENHTLLQLGDPQGEYELREEIAKYLYQARGAHCTPDQIIIGAGIEVLLQQLVLLFGDQMVYGVEDPGYHLIQRVLRGYPNEICPLEVDEKGVKVDNIDKTNINIVYVTPSRHFPYGNVLSANRRAKLINWASEKEDRYIIEDDYDSEFRYIGKSIPSLQGMDPLGKVIYLGSFSKSLMPSIRVSYMVIPKKLIEKYKEKLFFYSSTVSRIDQKILTEFMRNGDFERHLNRMRKIYRRKLEKLIEIIKPYDELKIRGEQSGLNIVLEVDNGMSESELVERALSKRLKIYPLSYYSLKYKYIHPPKIILGFAGIDEKELEKAVKLLLSSWDII